MPITVPSLDDRRYADLVSEAIARIPVHTPEWTNFNRSDPGITLIELFAFLTETTIYRANLIPERNRAAFLSLLGIPLQPATSAQGLVTISLQNGPIETRTLTSGLEVRAGEVAFRARTGLDVLPIEGRVFAKQPIPLTPELADSYRQLYASFLAGGTPGGPPPVLQPYQTIELGVTVRDRQDQGGLDLISGTVDGSLWVALLAPPNEDLGAVRAAMAGRVLNLGVVPVVADVQRTLPPGGPGAVTGSPAVSHLEYALPAPRAASPARPDTTPQARYAVREAFDQVNVLQHPGVVQIPLPAAAVDLSTWTDLDPLEEGSGEFPPAIDDPALKARVVTWLRVRARGVSEAHVLWAGVNAVMVAQRTTVRDELLPAGTGQPGQTAQLARFPVLPGSVRLTVTGPTPSGPTAWAEVADLLDAGPEVPVADPALPPGTPQPPPAQAEVFSLDPEAGLLRFGDGVRGRRPPNGSVLHVDYDYCAGVAGNVGPGSISTGPELPPGYAVSNPIRTWGGANAESPADGERQVSRYLQHRDRLVTAEDFATIARRTPGVTLARVDVLAAYDPQLAPNLPGDAPGAVTLMVVPRFDPAAPAAPSPDRFAIDAICSYLDERRLVTTELFLRGPDYVPIWISAGIDVLPGASVAEVQARVAGQLRRVLSPLPLAEQPAQWGSGAPQTYPHQDTGWPLRTPVTAIELAAYVTRVEGVHVVNELLLALGSDGAVERVELTGLQLPRVLGISVTPGAASPMEDVRGTSGQPDGPLVVPVPAFAEGC